LTPSVNSSQITYSITTGTTPDNTYCVSSVLGFATTISYTSTGTFTGNTYTAQLSDAMGSFASPINIGTSISNLNTGVINCSIPANTESGTGYMIRVISNEPSIIGTNSNLFEVILYIPCETPISAISSRNDYCENEGGTIDLSAIGGSGTLLSWYTSGCSGTLIGTGNPLNIEAPTTTTTYYARWENSCSNSSCASITVTVLPIVNAGLSIAASENLICEGTLVTFTATPSNGGSSPEYQWQLNGLDIDGQINSTYASDSLNNYDQIKCILISSETTCISESTATSNIITVTVNSIPETPTISQIENYILHSNVPNGNQWYDSNGLISGAVNQEYTVTSNETYYVIVTKNGCSSEQSNSIAVVINGIDILSNNKSFEIYPNPVSNELIIVSKDNLLKTRYEIYNSLGQVIYKGILIEKDIIQTTNFSSGIYIIKLENDKTLEFKKIVKK